MHPDPPSKSRLRRSKWALSRPYCQYSELCHARAYKQKKARNAPADQPIDRPTFARMGAVGGGGETLLRGNRFSCWGIKGSNFPLLLAFNPGCALILLAHALCVIGVCKLYDSAKLLQHYSTILNTTLLCDVEQGGQTNSILLITSSLFYIALSILNSLYKYF